MVKKHDKASCAVKEYHWVCYDGKTAKEEYYETPYEAKTSEKKYFRDMFYETSTIKQEYYNYVIIGIMIRV